MATLLKLVQGSTTVDLNDSTITEIVDYTPQAESVDVAEVSESATILVKSTSVATYLSKRSEIVDMLRRGRDRQRDPATQDPVYVTSQPDGAASAWRSEVLDFRIINEDNIHSVPLKNLKTKITLAWTRRNWWEANSESSLPLTNGNGSDATTGIVVFNCNDATGSSPNKNNNYVEIKAADAGGDLPAATRLEITNLSASYNISAVWIGQNWTDPTNAVEVYEAENATGETGSSNAGSSGGKYVTKSLSSGSETTLFTWPITSAAMSAARGQWVHALIRFSQTGWEPYTLFRLKVLLGLTTLWQSNQVQPSSEYSRAIWDLFQFRLPPALAGLGSLDALDMVLTGQQSSGSAQNIYFDFLALTPADNWRYLDYIGYGVPQNSRIVDDGINGYLYSDDGTDQRIPIYVGYGNPVMIMPNKLQRLYFWWHTTVGSTAPISLSVSVKVYYRARRLTL